MSILFVFIWNMIYVLYVRSEPLPMMCAYAGQSVYTGIANNYKLIVADIPKRCDVVIYGEHYFNGPPNVKDAPALDALVSAGKNVYMIYKYPSSEDWQAIISDPARLDKFIAPMIAYLNEKKLKGVILVNLGITSGLIPDYAAHINTLITKVKNGVPSIKVGIQLHASESPKFSAPDFDFNVINTNVDFYHIDLGSAGDSCHANILETGGRLPRTSTDPSILTLEKVYNAASISAMDQSKLVIGIFDLVTVSLASGDFDIKTYSDYCKGGNHGNDIWCGDTTKILYDEVTYLKTLFKALLINYLDFDDPDNICGCGKFVVANTFIDAFKNIPMKDCPKIS